MKYKWIAILIMMTFCVYAINVLEAASEINWNVSPRLWYANWNIEDWTNDSTLMGGIGISMSFYKFGFGLSFLAGDFDLGDDEYTTSINRTDTDLYLSFKIAEPYFSLSVGHKLINYELKYELYYDEKAKLELTGFGLGCAGAIPIVGNSYFYYIASIIPSMEAVIEYEDYGEKFEQDLSSYNIEFGAGYSINEKVSISLGWKYQQFDWDEGDDDSVSGITTMVIFNF